MATEGRPIIGYIHVCMINDFMRIFAEQLALIRTSGLYADAKEIKIGLLGSNEDKVKIESLIDGLPKFKIVLHDLEIKRYEFATLKILKEDSDLRCGYYGFYIHSKGVSWPNHPGGKYWRDYMNYYTLTKWRDAVAMLNHGYDTCGVKMVNKIFPLHYSGNFFWFKSDYISTLMPINKLNLTDRFSAEMWPCSGQPICATLCQDFVDYNTKGIFSPRVLEYYENHQGLG